VAATAAVAQGGVERVLVVDWDVHHGNGTQHIFEEDPSVMYFSVHRYDNGHFFPCSKDAAPEVVGIGAGQGFNVNVAWNVAWKDHQGMGDDEYLAAFQCALLPIARDFRPQLILVSAGFDAAAGDVGGCCLTPAGYAQMTRMLQGICPQVVLALEGGYKLGPISKCVSACARALLGESIPLRAEVRPKREACLSIERTLRSHRPFWPSLRNAKGSDVMSAASILIEGSALEVAAECAVNFMEGARTELVEELCNPDSQQRRTRVRHKKPKERAVTGVSISTRNAANANWKGDVKKLSRKELELRDALHKIESLKKARSRMSAKDRVLLEDEDELRWLMEEVGAELQELQSLSKDDVLRMYGGCC